MICFYHVGRMGRVAQLVEEDFTLSQVELIQYYDKTLYQIEELGGGPEKGYKPYGKG